MLIDTGRGMCWASAYPAHVPAVQQVVGAAAIGDQIKSCVVSVACQLTFLLTP